MPPKFFCDEPFNYSQAHKARIQVILENVIKTTDSTDVVLLKKSNIRRAGY